MKADNLAQRGRRHTVLAALQLALLATALSGAASEAGSPGLSGAGPGQAGGSGALGGSGAADAGRTIKDLSIDELMDVSVMDTPVTSVTRQKTRIADAPAAVTVLSAEEIRRSGHTSIAELLRMVPG